MTRSRWLDSPIRRGVDLVVAAGALAILSPVLLATAIAVRLRLGSPILFRQERAGLDGVPFEIVKFRSMTDERGTDGRILDDAERLTSFGRLVRGTSLDELPQLFTVMRGDMSLIGPRPLPLVYVERYDDRQRRRLSARPGITGWAQVNGRNSLDWPTKLELDVWYVEHASPRADAVIVARTVRSVFSRSGVTAADHASMPEFLGAAPADAPSNGTS